MPIAASTAPAAPAVEAERRLRLVPERGDECDGVVIPWAGRYRTDRLGVSRPVRTDDELAAARLAARRQLPSPAPLMGRLAMAVLEIEAGMRSATQLEKRCRPELWETLNQHLRRRGGPFVSCRALRRVLCQESSPGLADGVAVIGNDPRVGFVTMRLDASDGSWMLTHLGWGVHGRAPEHAAATQ